MNKKILIITALGVLALLSACGMNTESPNTEEAAAVTVVEGLIAEKEYEEAIIEIDKYLDGKKFVPLISDYYYSVCYNRLDLWEMGDYYIDFCLENSPQPIPAKYTYEKAIAAYGKGNYKEAIELFGSVSDEYEENAEYHYYSGLCYYLLDEADKELEEFEKAVFLEPDNYDFVMELAYTYYYYGDYEKEIEIIDTFIETMDSSDDEYSEQYENALIERGFVNYELGNYQDAIVDFDKCFEITEDPAYIHYQKAKCYAQLGEFDNVFKNLENAMKSDIESYCYYYEDDEVFTAFFSDETYGPLAAKAKDGYDYVPEE